MAQGIAAQVGLLKKLTTFWAKMGAKLAKENSCNAHLRCYVALQVPTSFYAFYGVGFLIPRFKAVMDKLWPAKHLMT